MPQLGVRALNAALAALCSFQVAGVFNRVAEEALRPTPAYPAAAASAGSAAVSAWDDRRIILDRNLFGAQIIAQPSVLEPSEPVEETKLPLVLEATIAATGESYSRAAIRDAGAPSSMVLGVGDPVTGHGGVSVAVIERGRVLLLNAGRLEELLLDEGSPSASVSRPGALRRRSRMPTLRRPRTPRKTSRREPVAPPVQEPSDSSDLDELTRRLQSGELTREDLSESIREQIREREPESERFSEMLGGGGVPAVQPPPDPFREQIRGGEPESGEIPGERGVPPEGQPPPDSPVLAELIRRMHSGELTREELSESIREQIVEGEVESERFIEILDELAEEEQKAIDAGND